MYTEGYGLLVLGTEIKNKEENFPNQPNIVADDEINEDEEAESDKKHGAEKCKWWQRRWYFEITY